MDGQALRALGSTLELGGTIYTIDGVMGRGGNAAVYLTHYPDALQPGINHSALVKELFPYRADGLIYRLSDGGVGVEPDAASYFNLHKDSFLKGNRVNLKLQGAYPGRGGLNINSYEAYGTLYTIMEYQGGETLSKRMDEMRVTTLEEAVELIYQLLDAIKYFHSSGILHLDVSPDNALLLDGVSERTRGALMFDYNSAWSLEEATGRTGVYLSVKEPYSSPEVRLGQLGDVSPASDLYSVCVIFAELVKGSKLNFEALSGTRLNKLFPVRESLIKDCPQTVIHQVLSILAKGLRLSPKQRFLSIEAMEAELDELYLRMRSEGVTHAALFEVSQRALARIASGRPDILPRDAGGERAGEAYIDGARRRISGEYLAEARAGAERHMLLLGEGGLGKTTTLVMLLASGAKRFNPAAPVPVYVALRDYTGQSDFILSSILDTLNGGKPYARVSEERRELIKLLRGGAGPGIILLADGLNEAMGDTGALVRELRALAEWAHVQIVATSRADVPGAPGARLTLLPLMDSQVERALLDAGVKPPSDPATYKLLSTPLMLSMYLRMPRREGDQPISDAESLIRAYIDSLSRAPQAPDVFDARLHFAVNILAPLIASKCARQKRGYINKQALYALCARLYSRLNTRAFKRRHPEYIGHTNELIGECKNADEWFGVMAQRILAGQLKLVYIDQRMRCHFFHDLILETLVGDGRAEERAYRVQRALAYLPVALGLIALAVAGAGLYTRANRVPGYTGQLKTYLSSCAAEMDSALFSFDDFVKEVNTVVNSGMTTSRDFRELTDRADTYSQQRSIYNAQSRASIEHELSKDSSDMRYFIALSDMALNTRAECASLAYALAMYVKPSMSASGMRSLTDKRECVRLSGEYSALMYRRSALCLIAVLSELPGDQFTAFYSTHGRTMPNLAVYLADGSISSGQFHILMDSLDNELERLKLDMRALGLID